jgi:hypothetical protein
VASGGSVLNPDLVGALPAPGNREDPLALLTGRELDVPALVAEGHGWRPALIVRRALR